jgi:putative DNA primase/helicase
MDDQKTPQEIHAEESILASIILIEEDREKAVELLTPEDFYLTRNRTIFEKCLELRSNGVAITTADIYSGLSDDEKKFVKAEFLGRLTGTIPVAMNIESDIEKLKVASSRRRVIELCNAIEKRCYSKNGDAAGIEQLAQEIIDGAKNTGATKIKDSILDFQNVISLELPEKRIFLDPWIAEQSITLISGWRGTGKTWLALSILNAISKGVKFGPWETETSVPCLYLDGEMIIQDMQYRAKQLEMDQDRKEPIYLYSDAHATNGGLPRANLLDEKWRSEMKALLLDKGIKLWVVDNIASLAPGINENVKEDWDPVNEFLLSLRFAGVATILLHHVGKKGQQRGTSAREDNIDTSIILKQPGDYETEEGCRFVMEFKKNRVVCGDHFLLADQEFHYSNGLWSWGDAKVKTKAKIVELLKNGAKNKDIAEELGVSAAYVSKVKAENQNH